MRLVHQLIVLASYLSNVFLLASGFCDTLDGIVARTFQQATVFGGFFDSVLDRYADAAVYAAIIIVVYAIRWVSLGRYGA